MQADTGAVGLDKRHEAVTDHCHFGVMMNCGIGFEI